MVGMTGISASPIKLALLGSTGSIGRQTLDVVRASPDRFHVVALAAGHNVRLLEEQAWEFRPQIVAATDQSDLDVPAGVRIADPANGLVECATWDSADVVLVDTRASHPFWRRSPRPNLVAPSHWPTRKRWSVAPVCFC